ncbi:hypothetical protein [Streptomyces sp. NPDC053079]|uniref:hypothetical protein n=1 Tax=Streptomyces sp. NPDC053079 TaxID=3365697 RepID=UPI0037D94224
MPHVKLTGALALVALVLLLAAVRAVGRPHWRWQAGEDIPVLPDRLVEWVMQCVAGAGQLLTVGGGGASAGARVGCLLLLLAFFAFLRRWMLARNAYHPGPVDVRRLVASDPEVEQQVEGLTAQLRKHLSETNLYPPTALPAEEPADNFLDLLGDVDLEPNRLGTSLLRFFSRLRPKIAYRVSGVLRDRPVEPRFGVTITVTSYAIRGSRTETIWATTWEEVVQAAGNWVMAALVPVTRASRLPPWRGWRGRDLHPDLFAAYQEGRRLGQERKFDDALDCYYAALRLDPMNLYLRTQIAGIQEKLWLHLDALETYYGAMLLDGHTCLQREKHLKRRFFRRRYRWWHNGLFEARYRYAVVLGIGEQTADEWCEKFFETSAHQRRQSDRKEIREALTPAFVDRYWRAFIGCHPSDVQDGGPFGKGDEARIRAWLRKQLADEPDREIVRVILQRACLEEMEQLARDYPRLSHLLPSTRLSGPLTWPSLRLNRDVWAPIRLAWAQRDLAEAKKGKYSISGLPSPGPWLEQSPEELDERVRRVMDRPLLYPLKRWARDCRLWRRRPWQESYNAACVYAVAMNCRDGQKDRERKDREALAAYAVMELEDAARTDRSGYQPLMRSWLLIEDPDLEALRRQERFIRFEREIYPHALPDHHRPKRPLRAEVMAYDQRLLTGAAKVMEHTWRARQLQLPADAHVLAHWFASDKELWECVYRVAKDQGYVWRDRAKLLKTVRAVADPTLLAECGLPSSLPDLDELLDDAAWFVLGGAEKRVKTLDEVIVRRL